MAATLLTYIEFMGRPIRLLATSVRTLWDYVEYLDERLRIFVTCKRATDSIITRRHSKLVGRLCRGPCCFLSPYQSAVELRHDYTMTGWSRELLL